MAAAKVGGIWANNTYPAEFIYDNIVIETNVIHACWKSGVTERLSHVIRAILVLPSRK